LRAFADLAWEHSASFRNQCQRLGAARAVVIVQFSRETLRAASTIGRSREGVTVARVRIGKTTRAVELIAHELEHVLEQVDGVKLLWEASRPGSGVVLLGGAYETRRAVDAGFRVAREVDVATRTHAKRDDERPQRGSAVSNP
jgi:hypothetical protein